ncbi:hypothetical protein AB0M29_10965 [Streptomyces sp. NPDC051976]|uniref:hypothetical protein n=1 Tax=Streptomyces sp. NPDC051976 TaxID=3154947 RepID=UPI003412BD42
MLRTPGFHSLESGGSVVHLGCGLLPALDLGHLVLLSVLLRLDERDQVFGTPETELLHELAHGGPAPPHRL